MYDIWSIVNSGLVLLVLSGIAGYVRGYVSQYNKNNREREELLRQLVEQNQKIAQWHTENIERDEKLRRDLEHLAATVKHITNGGKVLLRDRIIQSCRVFIEKGQINTVAKSNIVEMYHWYHDELKGNGMGELFFNKMMELPVIDDDLPIVSRG